MASTGTSRDTKIGYLYVLSAGIIWGSFAPLAKALYALNAPVLAVALLRPAMAFFIILIILAYKNKSYLKVRARDLPLMALYGLIGIGLFNFFFLYTIDVTTIITAVFLLYSAPVFVTVISRLAFKEPLVTLKVIALISSLVGLALLVEVFNPKVLKVSLAGIGTGLAAGLSYALFSIFGKTAMRKYSHWTALVYALGFGTVFLAFIALPSVRELPLTLGVVALLLLTGTVHTLAAYALYVRGLGRVEASRASILTMVEPVVASIIGMAFFAELISPLQALGGGFVILGAILTQIGA